MTRCALELAPFPRRGGSPPVGTQAPGFSRAKKAGAKRPSFALLRPQRVVDFHFMAIAPITGAA